MKDVGEKNMKMAQEVNMHQFFTNILNYHNSQIKKYAPSHK